MPMNGRQLRNSRMFDPPLPLLYLSRCPPSPAPIILIATLFFTINRKKFVVFKTFL